ncbi:MAG: hypothetical protein J6V54_08545 [Bacteroidales bacterium]|nr:hypothetical protein [Bacteroidales bacterium]
MKTITNNPHKNQAEAIQYTASAFLHTTLSSKNHVVYDPKLRHLHLKTPIVTTPKPHTFDVETA